MFIKCANPHVTFIPDVAGELKAFEPFNPKPVFMTVFPSPCSLHELAVSPPMRTVEGAFLPFQDHHLVNVWDARVAFEKNVSFEYERRLGALKPSRAKEDCATGCADAQRAPAWSADGVEREVRFDMSDYPHPRKWGQS